MKKLVYAVGLLALATTAPVVANAASGTPQRAGDLPPGLAKVFVREIPGITRALLATAGSNSRLQDLPVSP
ncbi:MAG: hypothetical protein WA842_09310 [Croceibacterium sp.]